MSLTGNFILWNSKTKPQKYEACCSETMSVRNEELKQSLRRLSVPDRSHKGWKVTFSPVQRALCKSCAQRQRRAHMEWWGKYRSQAVPCVQGYIQSHQGPRPAASPAGPSPCISPLRRWTRSMGSRPLASFGSGVLIFISPKDLRMWNLLGLDGKWVGNLTQ